MKLIIYVPAQHASLTRKILAAGTAIVANPEVVRVIKDKDQNPIGRYLTCYYEGNIYGADNLQDFESRAICAAGRLATRYPTIARSEFAENDLLEVGEMDISEKGVTSSIEIHEGTDCLIQEWCENR